MTSFWTWSRVRCDSTMIEFLTAEYIPPIDIYWEPSPWQSLPSSPWPWQSLPSSPQPFSHHYNRYHHYHCIHLHITTVIIITFTTVITTHYDHRLQHSNCQHHHRQHYESSWPFSLPSLHVIWWSQDTGKIWFFQEDTGFISWQTHETTWMFVKVGGPQRWQYWELCV